MGATVLAYKVSQIFIEPMTQKYQKIHFEISDVTHADVCTKFKNETSILIFFSTNNELMIGKYMA